MALTEKACDFCEVWFKAVHGNQRYCSYRCRKNSQYARRQEYKAPVLLDSQTRGAYSELSVTNDLLVRGYMVFRNISSSGSIDLIAVQRGEYGGLLRIEVKTRADTSSSTTKSLRYEEGKYFDHLAVVNHEGEIEYHPALPEENQ
jgi:hypothetical protein